ncbi:type VI secretion system protein TssA [Cognatazoarcus halotolerans]|uniref:type VI secretion system protein TssA n=1 Tax=Cognatazoarcus halotolerans TaxID=2686016 RepID=UPI00135BA7AE|nr:type VI secretion system protein TssA [Cognatazoarcus halotolerans]MCB1899646.1 type VI secretion system protein TssA [Rhodocyclaceae bacterium]MCP5309301.1 type VI secretion system protein TssA [Zoogloeaceae bacterium]
MQLASLLAPVPGGTGCGEDLSFSDEFDEIAEARREDDPSLAQGEWISVLKEADWSRVARICETLLVERSKDLRIAGWLAEAWARQHGLAGVAAGFRLVEGLCASYWDALHPLPEDGDQELRAGALAWFAGHATEWLRRSPLTDSPQGRYGLADLEAARAHARNPETTQGDGHAAASDRVSIDRIEAARRTTPVERLRAFAAAAHDCGAALDALESLLAGYLGEEAPGWAPAREVLETLQTALGGFPGEACAALPAEEQDAAVAQVPALPLRQEDLGAGMTRERAIRQLREVAAFFRATEPHSPVAYLADKAARWGEMPLHDWLRSVVRDDGELARIEELLGLEARDGGG